MAMAFGLRYAPSQPAGLQDSASAEAHSFEKTEITLAPRGKISGLISGCVAVLAADLAVFVAVAPVEPWFAHAALPLSRLQFSRLFLSGCDSNGFHLCPTWGKVDCSGICSRTDP